MTEPLWTDAEPVAVDLALHADDCPDDCPDDDCPGGDLGEYRREAEIVLAALAPLVAARESQAAAKALREFGPWVQQEHACDPEGECPEGTCRLCDLLFAVYADANDRADRIERGES